MTQTTPATNYGWLRFFYLVLGLLWLTGGLVDVLRRGGWFGWAGMALGVAFLALSAAWFRKVRRQS